MQLEVLEKRNEKSIANERLEINLREFVER